MNDRDFLVVCAARYCLGRQSYIVGMMCDYLKKNAANLNREDRLVIIRDIEEQEKWGYGDECDKDEWLSALSALKAVGVGARK